MKWQVVEGEISICHFYDCTVNLVVKMRWLVPCILFITSIVATHSYFITVDAHAEECFFDKVEFGTKMG